MSNTLLPKNVDVSKFKYSEVKTLSNGSKTVYINYGGDKLTLQTPIMSLPYGIGDWNGKEDKKKDEGKKYDLHLSFRGWDENPKLKVLLDKMKDIENKLKEDAFNNRLTWFRDDYDGSKALVDRLFTPIVKYDKDKDTGKVVGKYPPTLKVKLPYDNKVDDFTFECTDMDGNDIDFKSVMTKLKGAKARLIIQLSGVWMAGGKYGVTWKVLKGTFDMPSKSKYDYIEDSDDEAPSKKRNVVEPDEDLEEDAIAMAESASPVVTPKKPVTKAPETDDEDDVPPPAPKKGNVVVRDDDEEEEEVAEEENDSELEDEPTPPPPPKTKKTSVAAKKK